jgi:hypothetical protein
MGRCGPGGASRLYLASGTVRRARSGPWAKSYRRNWGQAPACHLQKERSAYADAACLH